MNQNCSQNSISLASNNLKMRLRLGLCPGPTGGAYSAPPDSLAGFMGPLHGWGGGREMGGRNGGEGEEGEGV